jgi:hypothetical protein
LRHIEEQLRQALRDGVNRPSRKPFYWGGLTGYQQLEVIAQALQTASSAEAHTTYCRQLLGQVERVLTKNRASAEDLQAAHTWLRRIAACLRYPAANDEHVAQPTGQQVATEMEALLKTFHPDFKRQPAQSALYHAWQRLWRTWGPELLPCYDIPGLPPDNLALEALFGHLRRHQRRISGRQSTRELRRFGQCQVRFLAQSEADLYRQLQQVPLADYQHQLRCLEAAEAPQRYMRRLHRDPLTAMRDLMDRYVGCLTAASPGLVSPTDIEPSHTS